VTPSDDTPPTTPHGRPDGVRDETVRAVGTLSEAYEYLIRARGHLYSFHQLMGRVDNLIGDSVDELREAGHDDLAAELERDVVGRNVLDGRWTFQIVEEFDATYFGPVTEAEARVRNELMDGRRHVFESELKDGRITRSRPGHERRPPATYDERIETE
jgi:hypothetical protein